MDSNKRYQIRGNNKPLFEYKNELKIDCDAFRVVDWDMLAQLIYSKGFRFGHVIGVGSGGLLLQRFLTKYKRAELYYKMLVVADVYTTGFNLINAAEPYTGHYEIEGVVVFNMGKCPSWVTPMFNLGERFR